MNKSTIIDDKLLSKLERLAMIDLEEAQKAKVADNLNEILGFIENLSAVDTDSISLESHAKTPLRDDVPHNSGIAGDVLAHAPKAQDNYFVVPKIIE